MKKPTTVAVGWDGVQSSLAFDNQTVGWTEHVVEVRTLAVRDNSNVIGIYLINPNDGRIWFLVERFVGGDELDDAITWLKFGWTDGLCVHAHMVHLYQHLSTPNTYDVS